MINHEIHETNKITLKEFSLKICFCAFSAFRGKKYLI